jgi:hypothetical protein
VSKTSIQFEKCYLDSLKIVVNHDVKEDFILIFGSFLKQLATSLNGEIRISQLSEATPPEIPRAIIITKEIQIQFGLNRIEVEIKGMRKHVHRSSLYDLYKHRIKETEDLIQSYLNHVEFVQGFAGIVAPVRFPQSMNFKKDELLGQLHFLCTGRTNNRLVSFSQKVGLNKDDKFENFEISDYEVKNVNISAPITSQHVALNLEEFPTVERGIMSIVDVNNKPKSTKFEFSDDVAEVVATFFKTIESFESYLS